MVSRIQETSVAAPQLSHVHRLTGRLPMETTGPAPLSPRVRAERAGRFSFPALSPGHPGQSSLGPSLWRSSCQRLNASGPCPAQAQPLQDPYLSLLTADLTQPQGPLLARGGGGLDPAFGADFLQERGHIRVNILAASSWTTGPGQCGPQGMLWHLLRGQFALS